MKFFDPRLICDCQNKKTCKCQPEAVVPQEEIDHGKMPRWLQSALVHRSGKPHWCGGSDPTWMDHWGTATINGKRVFVSEPYGLSDDGVRNLMEFCSKYKIKVDIQAASWHYPTHCLRIILTPPANFRAVLESAKLSGRADWASDMKGKIVERIDDAGLCPSASRVFVPSAITTALGEKPSWWNPHDWFDPGALLRKMIKLGEIDWLIGHRHDGELGFLWCGKNSRQAKISYVLAESR